VIDAPPERILLTGATGFIGRQVLRNLPVSADIHCTTRNAGNPQVGTWHAVDLRDSDSCAALVAAVKPDLLIHCAWTTEHGAFWHDPQNAAWCEAGMTLFNAFVRQGGSRIVACGTCAEYSGDRPFPRREDEEIDPERIPSHYGRAKFALLEHLRGLNVSYAWARIFLVYGEGEEPRRLVPSMLRAFAAGEPAQCSSGTQVRDFLDVRDVGAACARLATSDVEGVINLGYGERTTIEQIVETLGRIANRPDLVQLGAVPDRKGEPRLLIPDITRQTKELGFVPRIALDHGLADAAKLWLANK
jgi:nucleoside-diphosphate-sugar epimerase